MRKQKRTDRPVSIFEMVFGLTVVVIGIVACMVHNHNAAKAAEPLPTEYPAAVVVIPTAEPIAIEDVPVEATPEPSAEVFTAYIYDVPLEDELQLYIVRLCEEHHINPAVVVGMIQRESAFEASAMGDSGNSYGLMQIQKRFHSDRMDKLGVTDLLDPFQNVAVGIDLLAELINYYDGNVEMALMAYNAGCSGAYEHWFSKGVYSNDYSKAVLEVCEELNSRPLKMVTNSAD